MPLDTLICGLCVKTFTDINDFVLHKQTGCTTTITATTTTTSQPVKEETDGGGGGRSADPVHHQVLSKEASPSSVVHHHMQVNEAGHVIKLEAHHSEGDAVGHTRGDSTDLTFLDDVHMEADLGLDRPGTSVDEDSAGRTYVILKDTVDLDGQDPEAKLESAFAQLEGSELEVLSSGHLMAPAEMNSTNTTTVIVSQEEFEAILQKQQQQQQQHHTDQQALKEDATEPAPKKRCAGRAKKGEGKNQIPEAVPPSTPRPSAPETNADGKLACPQCKRTFTKERHFNTHKCLASSSYVDISKRDVVKIDSGDDEDEETGLYLDIDDGAIDDTEDEFSAPMEDSLQAERDDEEDENAMDRDEGGEGYSPGDGDGDKDNGNGKRKKGRKRGRPSRFKSSQGGSGVGSSDSVNTNHMKQAVEAMENLPIFKNDDDKVAFEACIDVDLSQVDHMFRVHVIEQDINDTSGMVYNTPTVSSLSVYSCTVCEKVFKSLSHIRLHCITHTDLKPFKCNKCDYTTNSKGNLYTHMRKHTGQYYRCDQCDFKSVNKSHLVEHQMTHDSRRPTCMLCNKDYSTIKSMINHIRKYHTNKAGKEYLATFLSGKGQKGNTVIHQCHVCNRKFKKRIDRDRHLFIHDIKDLPNVQLCELCDYWASRKVYLDKHYLKHRVIYCCAGCPVKFLSIARLTEHLNTQHCTTDENGVLISNVLLEECINGSYYLPEPVATSVEGSKYINLPPMLTGLSQQEVDQYPDDNGQPSLAQSEVVTAQDEDVKDTNEETLCADSESRKENPLIGLSDNKSSNSPTKSIVVNDVAGSSDNSISVLSSAPSDSAFPFPTEYGELIPESSGGQSNFTDAEESGVKMGADTTAVSQNDLSVSLTASSSSEVNDLQMEFTKKDSCCTDVESGSGEKSGLVSTPPSTEITGNELQESVVDGEKEESSLELKTGGDVEEEMAEQRTNQDAGSSVVDLSADNKTDNGESGAAQMSSTALLMLQNPGSDTEEKEEEGQTSKEDAEMQEEENNEDLVEEDEDIPEETMEDTPKEMTEGAEPDNSCSNESAVNKEMKDDKEVPEGEGTPVVKAESKDDKIQGLIDRMGYHKMSLEIFNKMRETFGTEECEYCGRLFYNKMDHETHIRTHTGDKPFACAHCSFRATTRDGLRRHSEKEHEKIAYQCKECDFLAPTRTRLWNHQLKHLGLSGLSCSQCSQKFDSMKQLRAHLINTHQDMDKETMEKLTGYVRRPQGKMGRRSFKCPHCPRVFIRANSELQKHIWIHEGIKPFTCPICPYACRSKNNLQAHMLRHSAEKPFSCSECGKEYKSKTALRWHVRSHKSGKMFKCDKCPYEATQSSHLKRHMEIHDVVKRFICKHCKFSANTLGYMKIHYAKHHKGLPFIHEESTQSKDAAPNKGVFKCLSCGYLFGNMSDLKRHLRVRHHIQMQDIAGMDQMQISEVEVVQFNEAAMSNVVQPLSEVQQAVAQSSQQQVATGDFQLRPQEEGGMPASTANLIQQIFGIGQGDSQQVRVVSEDGQPLDISQDTIILQQDGQLLMTTTNDVPAGVMPGNQYIIQYFNPGEVPQESSAMGDHPAVDSIQIQSIPSSSSVSIPAPEHQQIQLIQQGGDDTSHSHSQSQPAQFIITSGGGDIGGATTSTTTQLVTQSQPEGGDSCSILPSSSSNLNNSVNVGQLVMTSSEGQPTQLVSIEGQTQILTTTAVMTSTAGNEENGNGHGTNQLMLMDQSSQQLGGEGEEAHYVTSDVEAYSTQLIISDPGVAEVIEEEQGQGGVNLVCEDAEVCLEEQ